MKVVQANFCLLTSLLLSAQFGDSSAESGADRSTISVEVIDPDTQQPIADRVNAYLLLPDNGALDTNEFEVGVSGLLDVESTFRFPEVSNGEYLLAVESVVPMILEDGRPNLDAKYIPTYYQNAFEFIDADTLVLSSDTLLTMEMIPSPPPPAGHGTVEVIVYEEFVDAITGTITRKRAAGIKCGLRRKRSGGRVDQDDDEFELIAYTETDGNGKVTFKSLFAGTYRFFVNVSKLDISSFIEFEMGQAGISDTEFRISVILTSTGLMIGSPLLGIGSEIANGPSIYPNPVKDFLVVESLGEKTTYESVQIIDLNGRVVFSEDLDDSSGRLQLDVSFLPSGQYLVSFESNNSITSQTFRMIKE